MIRSNAMWLTDKGTATRRRLARASGGLLGSLVFLSACRPPATTQAPTGAVDQPQSVSQAGPQSKQQSARLPAPGVFALMRVRGLAIPADLKPSGAYNLFERVIGGRLYLTPDSIYHTIICADLVGSTDKGPNTMDRQTEGRYWTAGGRIYFSALIVDGPPDSIAVRVRGDTIEFAANLYVRDQTSSLAAAFLRGPPIPAYVCAPVRNSLERGAHPKPSDISHGEGL
jgi:hypothetical protein